MYIKDFWFGTFRQFPVRVRVTHFSVHLSASIITALCFVKNVKKWQVYWVVLSALQRNENSIHFVAQSLVCKSYTVSHFFPSWRVLFSVECTCIVPVCVFVSSILFWFILNRVDKSLHCTSEITRTGNFLLLISSYDVLQKLFHLLCMVKLVRDSSVV
jgi:hypothetical protein